LEFYSTGKLKLPKTAFKNKLNKLKLHLIQPTKNETNFYILFKIDWFKGTFK